MAKKFLEPLYEDRIVVFIDILGFKQLINSTLDSHGNEIPARSNHVKKLLDMPEEVFKEHPDLVTSKVISRFSDSIVVSFKYTEESQVFYTLLDILHLQLELVNIGELVRGAVCFGKIYHTSDMIFGPGIVRAYEFETQAAIFPRVIIEPEVIRVGAEHSIAGHTAEIETEHIEDIIARDADGIYYVDYFENAKSELDYPDLQWPTYLSSLKNIIEKGMKNKSPGVLNKYSWLRERYNSIVDGYNSPEFLQNVRENLDEEFVDFYENLKKIDD